MAESAHAHPSIRLRAEVALEVLTKYAAQVNRTSLTLALTSRLFTAKIQRRTPATISWHTMTGYPRVRHRGEPLTCCDVTSIIDRARLDAPPPT